MPLKYFTKNKNLANILFVSILLPYLLLCLTMGGFHDSIFNTKHSNHTHQFSSQNSANITEIGVLESASQHDSETCQICQWLKTLSTVIQFLLPDPQFDYICNNFVYYSNPVLPSLSIQKFTIRPPPSFPLFFSII